MIISAGIPCTSTTTSLNSHPRKLSNNSRYKDDFSHQHGDDGSVIGEGGVEDSWHTQLQSKVEPHDHLVLNKT